MLKGLQASGGQIIGQIPSSQINATATNDSAAAGVLGEFATQTLASGSAVALTTATPANITATLVLTAGDWEIDAQVDYTLTGATVTVLQSGPSLTTATLPTQAGGGGLGTDALASDLPNLTTATGTLGQGGMTVRGSFAATTNVFLVASATFSAGTVAAYGTIRARRAR